MLQEVPLTTPTSTPELVSGVWSLPKPLQDRPLKQRPQHIGAEEREPARRSVDSDPHLVTARTKRHDGGQSKQQESHEKLDAPVHFRADAPTDPGATCSPFPAKL